MTACDKPPNDEEGSRPPRDIEEPFVMKKVTKLNATASDEVDAAPRPSIERQNSMEKLQFNAKKAIVAGMLDITLVKIAFHH